MKVHFISFKMICVTQKMAKGVKSYATLKTCQFSGPYGRLAHMGDSAAGVRRDVKQQCFMVRNATLCMFNNVQRARYAF
jgi:hypothetical protein